MKVSAMELYQLESFLAVVKTGSLSKAAVLRNISLPGISKHIKLLEEDLGFPLFARNAKGMALTENGSLVLRHAEEIHRNVDCLYALASRTPPIRIGLNISPDFIELFHLKSLLDERHPRNKTVLINHNSSVLLGQLAGGELDLCLAFGEVPERFRKLFIRNVRMSLMIPISLDDGESLDRKCWIINTADCPFKPPLEEFWRVQGIIPRSTFLAQDLSRKEMIAQGLGIGFLEPHDCLSLAQAGLARQHSEHFLEVGLWVVFQDGDFRPTAEFIQQYVRSKYECLAGTVHSQPTISRWQSIT